MKNTETPGQIILAAGEIGAYTVCPESWKLRYRLKVQNENFSKTVDEGKKLHKEWSEHYDEAIFLAQVIKYIITLACLAIVLFLFLKA